MKAITIAGRVGRDAVTRNTPQGDQVTGFSVAVDEGYGDKKRTVWFDMSFWGKRGASVAPFLTKGAQVTVSGDLSTREHEGKTYLTIRANDLTLQGGKRDDAGWYDRPAQEAQEQTRNLSDDEIPF